MLSFFDIVIIMTFSILFVLSVLAQHSEKVRKYNYLGLLPDFRFFAPKPVSRDLCVFVRGISISGEETKWMPIVHAKKNWWCFIWNPDHRLRKTVSDLFRYLNDFRDSKDIWHLSFPYLTLLNISTNLLSKDLNIVKAQFMIACFAGHEEAIHDVLFLSNVHRLS